MPNHVTNIIEADETVIKAILNDDKLVDFCKVIPRHVDLELNGADGISCVAESAAELMCKEKISDHDLTSRLQSINRLRSSALEMDGNSFEQFVMMMRNKRNHGFYHMIDYARNAWGTKWNAYSQNADDNTPNKVKFETAWSHPFPVLEALSNAFPDQEIKVIFADEDLGSNCGTYVIKNGNIIEQDIASSRSDQTCEEKKKWVKFAFEINYPNGDPKEMGYNEFWEYDESLT